MTTFYSLLWKMPVNVIGKAVAGFGVSALL
jgi:hypothetical protein